MAELYAKGDLSIVFEAGRTVGNFAVSGDLADIHAIDAAAEVIQQVHVLVRPHDDAAKTRATLASPPDPDCSCEEAGKKLLEAIDECEAKCPKADESATALALDPATLELLRVIAGCAWKILRDWFS